MLPNRAFFVASFVSLTGFVSVVSLVSLVSLLAACSGDSLPTGSSGDPGSSSGSSSSSGTTTSGSSGSSGASSSTSSTSSSGASGSSGGGNAIAACISACEAKYPKGAQIGKGIDQCWAKSCPTQCNGIGAGQQKPPFHGTCKNPVTTPSSDCSQCTVDKCCNAWDACFNDTDCSALNTCSIACYK